MKWFNFLHFYQPANIEGAAIKEAAEKSYFRLLRLFEEHADLRMTINISGGLLERMAEEGLDDFSRRLKILIQAGRIEIVGSAAYHAFLPLLPESEVIYQIKEQEKILKKHFGIRRPRGFFLPEMAYTSSLAQIIKKCGYHYLILDPITYSRKNKKALEEKVSYQDKASGLKIVFRNRRLSMSYAPEYLTKCLANGHKDWLVTAVDAELYGLRYEDPTAEIEKIMKNPYLSTGTLSEFLSSTPSRQSVVLRSSSWESSEVELAANQPFILWNDQKNEVQTKLWQLAELAITSLEKYPRDKNYAWARWHLSRGLASCSWWWASGHDFSRHFGPLAWSPEEVERGVNDLLRSIRSLANSDSRRFKLKAEKLALEIRFLVWTRHWQKYFK